ncbi:ABC transporter permease, partial [Klebsiella pneumoniae]|nr:ABC transporter permease [Klebsiella pneumoniae]
RALTLFGVLIAVLVLLAVSLGATGFSDKILQATVGEELRALRTSLTQTIRDPDRLEAALEARRRELLASYGLDQPWYARIPGMVWRVLTLDL